MNYSEAEQSIVGRLSPLVETGIQVSLMPNVLTEWVTPTGPYIWVSYERSRYDQTNDDPRFTSSGPTMQKEVLQFNITINARKLRGGNGGIMEIISAARALLYGFKPANCHALYMIEISPEKFDENLWTYKMVMGCQSVVMQADDEVIGELISRITLESSLDDTQINIPTE